MLSGPCRRLRCGARRCRPFLIPCFFFVALAPAVAVAAANSWTKPTSGFWEEQSFWSLGVLPDATQDVVFTNAGFKALTIGPQTAQTFPLSLSVNSLRVSAPDNSSNTLVMSFSGFERPLKTGVLTVEPNAAVVMQSAALEVLAGGTLSIVGSFHHGDFSQVVVRFGLSLDSGSYFLTNGILTVASFLENFGRFIHYGGSNIVGSLQIFQHGEYHLYDGRLRGSSFRISDHGLFVQYGGNVTADVDVGFDFTDGRYVLSDGTLMGRMIVPSARGSGSVVQYGGTNSAVSLDIGNGSRFGGMGSYVLSNGVLQVDSSTTLRALGTFEQWNGRHTITSNLVMRGNDLGPLGGVAYAAYSLRGGTLSAMNLAMGIATFVHKAGSNRITGDIVLGPASQTSLDSDVYTSLYSLSGGFLSAANVILNASANSGFAQTGGTHDIAGELRISGQAPGFHGYTLNGGGLSVNNMSISNGAAFHHNGGVVSHSGGLTLAGGSWHARPGAQALGPVRLVSGELADSSIEFPEGAAVLRLANSSTETWSSTATLSVTNWHGSASGGGETQLFFGSDAGGLTLPQLARIKFSLAGELLPARILATGEVVPQTQRLGFSFLANMLTLSWEPGWTLQSSTNVAGPYEDVPGAVTPFEPSMSNPTEFFRLRQ